MFHIVKCQGCHNNIWRKQCKYHAAIYISHQIEGSREEYFNELVTYDGVLKNLD